VTDHSINNVKPFLKTFQSLGTVTLLMHVATISSLMSYNIVKLSSMFDLCRKQLFNKVKPTPSESKPVIADLTKLPAH
jgi:hypothetical protein